jgi:hypothetical protein
MLAQLTQLGELRASGVLTETEFEVQKARILSGWPLRCQHGLAAILTSLPTLDASNRGLTTDPLGTARNIPRSTS